MYVPIVTNKHSFNLYFSLLNIFSFIYEQIPTNFWIRIMFKGFLSK